MSDIEKVSFSARMYEKQLYWVKEKEKKAGFVSSKFIQPGAIVYEKSAEEMAKYCAGKGYTLITSTKKKDSKEQPSKSFVKKEDGDASSKQEIAVLSSKALKGKEKEKTTTNVKVKTTTNVKVPVQDEVKYVKPIPTKPVKHMLDNFYNPKTYGVGISDTLARFLDSQGYKQNDDSKFPEVSAAFNPVSRFVCHDGNEAIVRAIILGAVPAIPDSDGDIVINASIFKKIEVKRYSYWPHVKCLDKNSVSTCPDDFPMSRFEFMLRFLETESDDVARQHDAVEKLKELKQQWLSLKSRPSNVYIGDLFCVYGNKWVALAAAVSHVEALIIEVEVSSQRKKEAEEAKALASPYQIEIKTVEPKVVVSVPVRSSTSSISPAPKEVEIDLTFFDSELSSETDALLKESEKSVVDVEPVVDYSAVPEEYKFVASVEPVIDYAPEEYKNFVTEKHKEDVLGSVDEFTVVGKTVRSDDYSDLKFTDVSGDGVFVVKADGESYRVVIVDDESKLIIDFEGPVCLEQDGKKRFFANEGRKLKISHSVYTYIKSVTDS